MNSLDLNLIQVRRPRIDFGNGVVRFYVKDNPIISHFISGLNIQFPEGENFFVRSVSFFKDQINDPQLSSDIKAFCGQELQHKNQTSIFLNLLINQNYQIKNLMNIWKWYQRRLLQALPARFRLAYTVGCEHLTATIAYATLKNHILDKTDPIMRQLLLWHSIEEMEHKHVAFDVFTTVFPKHYFSRLLGFLMSVFSVFGWALFCCGKLIIQDFHRGGLNLKQFKIHWINLINDRGVRGFLKITIVNLIKYIKPGFHPRQINDRYLLDLYMPELQKFS